MYQHEDSSCPAADGGMKTFEFKIDWSLHTLLKLLSSHSFETVLDIGAGVGHHANFLRHFGKKVYTVDQMWGADYVGDFMDIEFEQQFDVVWCSHVLEHQRNVGLFLEKVYDTIKDDGVLAMTVPFQEREVLLGGHVTLWDPGLLCYNLVLSGFDLSEAAFIVTYDLALVTKKIPVVDFGDLRSNGASRTELGDLDKYFPFKAYQRCNGLVKSANWKDFDYNLPDPVEKGNIFIHGRNLPPEGLLIEFKD